MTTTILALDLGTTTGWALRGSDGHITSGSESFRPQRFEGGGMRFLRFKRWLTEIKQSCDGIDALHFEEVRRHVSTDAAQHILVVSPDDERLDWMERELVRQIGERLYGAGGRRHG